MAAPGQRGRLPRPLALLLHGLLIAIAITTLAPFAWMVLTSFKSSDEVFQRHFIPQAISLGDEGQILTTVDGQVLYSVTATSPGQVEQPVEQPLRIRLGTPRGGNFTDQARLPDGTALLDDLGQPVLLGHILPPRGPQLSYRDARTLSIRAEPLLVPRDLLGAANEQAARRYYRRFDDAAWETMVRERWKGRVPAMLTAELREELGRQSASSAALVLAGQIVMDPFASSGASPYLTKNLKWFELETPIRHYLGHRSNLVVGDDGRPIDFVQSFPVYRDANENLAADNKATSLRVRVGSATAPPTDIRGASVATTARVRLVTGNYQAVLTDPNLKFSLFAWNSFFVCILTVLLKMATSCLAAFAFARLTWKGRDAVFACYLGTLMIPGIVTAIPNYLILQQLGWLNTFAALIVPGAATAYGTFMLRQFMLTMPRGLEEAARIDGASWLRVWWDIAVPLSKPALITLAIFTFAGTWQSFSWPLIVAGNESVRVLPVALNELQKANETAYHLHMAASVILMIPTLLLFIFGQKYFVSGMQIGAVKG